MFQQRYMYIKPFPQPEKHDSIFSMYMKFKNTIIKSIFNPASYKMVDGGIYHIKVSWPKTHFQIMESMTFYLTVCIWVPFCIFI